MKKGKKIHVGAQEACQCRGVVTVLDDSMIFSCKHATRCTPLIGVMICYINLGEIKNII